MQPHKISIQKIVQQTNNFKSFILCIMERLIENLNTKQLREICRRNGWSVAGLKQDSIARILDNSDDEDEDDNNPETEVIIQSTSTDTGAQSKPKLMRISIFTSLKKRFINRKPSEPNEDGDNDIDSRCENNNNNKNGFKSNIKWNKWFVLKLLAFSICFWGGIDAIGRLYFSLFGNPLLQCECKRLWNWIW